MSHGRNKHQVRENLALVRNLFMSEWDPIGVSGIPQAADEYDSYAAKAYVMLMDERADVGAITNYLWNIATEHMGLSPRADLADRCKRTAKTLVEMRQRFELH